MIQGRGVRGVLAVLAVVALTAPAQGQTAWPAVNDFTLPARPPPAAAVGAEGEGEGDLAPPRQPREWSIVPHVDVQEMFTDNPRLSAARHGDLITAVTPGIGISGSSRRLSGNLDANLTYDKYAWATDLDGAVVTAAGNGLAEAIEKTLFIDLRADVSREAVRRSGADSGVLRTQSANQAQVFNASISPYLHHDFADDAAGELRYRLSVADFANGNSGDTTPGQPATAIPANSWTDEYIVGLHSGPSFTRLRWGLDGSISQSHYGDSRLVQQGSGLASAEWVLMREAALLAKGGWDSVRDTATGLPADGGPAALGGVRLTPGPRTSVTVLGGRRWQGPYWSAEATYRLSDALMLAASHDTTVTTAQQQINGNLNGLARNTTGALVDPVTGQPQVNPNQLANAYARQIYTLDTNKVSLTGERGPDRVSVALQYLTERLGAQGLDQSGAGRESVAELDGTYTRRLSRVSDTSLILRLSRTYDSTQTNEATIAQVGLSYGHDFSSTLRGTVSVRHTDLSDPVGTGYRENVALVGVHKEM